jgi:ring-1,2-phenylacetyl-CoA epoxidase subunit PaaD
VSAPTRTRSAEERRVWEALEQVPDPELPVISLVDLGVILDVEVGDGRARVRFVPTFVGCPALEPMRAAIAEAVAALGLEPAVETSLAEGWSSERITPRGRERLAAAGIAPPGAVPPPAFRAGALPLQVRAVATCPYCGSTSTRRENAFGPTPCRSVWYCDGCRQPFEGFKAI